MKPVPFTAFVLSSVLAPTFPASAMPNGDSSNDESHDSHDALVQFAIECNSSGQ